MRRLLFMSGSRQQRRLTGIPLETFFESVASDTRGHHTIGKRLCSLAGLQTMSTTLSRLFIQVGGAFEQACSGLVSGAGLRHTAPTVGVATKVAADHHEVISQLF